MSESMNDSMSAGAGDSMTTITDTANMFAWQQDADGIVTLTMDDPGASVNTLNHTYARDLGLTLDRLEAERESITGVILTSAKRSFFAGGDLALLIKSQPEDVERLTAEFTEIKDQFRRIEKLGIPVVAAINGAALGGGLEVALACHHRIALRARSMQIGFPEITLGLLPGAGGITRTVRMLGLQDALTKLILSGTKYSADDAKQLGLIDEVVDSVEELHERAREWVRSNPSPVKPWDEKGFRIPGGSPTSPALAANLPAFPANLRKQTKGAPLQAPRAAMAAAVEGAHVDFDTASLIETRYFVHLLIGQVSKNMTNAFFFDLQKINSGGSRPKGQPKWQATKVGILGAGMMGAAIAYVCAKAGIEVVLKDVSLEAAERGKSYSEGLEKKALERGRTTVTQSEELLARIRPTAESKDFAGVDIVIEAVFEGVEVKQEVFREIQDIVQPDAVLGSNTSSLPITLLSEGVSRPADFIGIHFFSPVEKMPLVEIVRGRNTSDEVLAKVFDFVLQIRKTPIVVGDGHGFFTTRVIMTFIAEAVAALGEGVEPVTIEQAATQAGYPVGALQLLDELTLTLGQKLTREAQHAAEAAGTNWVAHPFADVVDRMLELGRKGRSSHAGFYDYDENGRRLGLWPELRSTFNSGSAQVPFEDLQERMLFAEALETVRCVDDGVLTSAADANIGSILGIGFPAWTGGVLQYINQYEGGLQGFVARARELAESYGPHFEPPASLVAMADAGESFH
jgi:3-hydroxyacyl-CoA dehydrogenase/enoyl-CoA hydratase/3-hydroxybutyryl-CoA epimerase